MINKIIDGICVAINGEFGDEHNIYTETVNQGLKPGSFMVLCLNPTIEQFFGKRYFRTNQFCIHYFPQTNEPRSENLSVMERLHNALENITVDGDLCRGTTMHAENVDDVLSFFVNYDMFVYKDVTAEPSMEDVNYNNNVKG